MEIHYEYLKKIRKLLKMKHSAKNDLFLAINSYIHLKNYHKQFIIISNHNDVHFFETDMI